MEEQPFHQQPGFPFPPHHDQHQHHVPHHVMPQFEHHTQGSYTQQPVQPMHHQPSQPQPSQPLQPLVPTPQPPRQELAPQPVVQVLSPRGIEYVFLTLTLFIGAFGLGWAIIAMINGQFRATVLGFPVACLVVALPVFAWLFLRLKQAELDDPSLRTDPSKRRTTQLTQIVSFIISMFAVIGLITALVAKIAGQYSANTAQIIFSPLVIFLISGGILFYYWRNEHRR